MKVSDLKMSVPSSNLVREARSLKSEDGENSEYDRALLELVTYACGLSVNEHGADVAEELGLDMKVLYPSNREVSNG